MPLITYFTLDHLIFQAYHLRYYSNASMLLLNHIIVHKRRFYFFRKSFKPHNIFIQFIIYQHHTLKASMKQELFLGEHFILQLSQCCCDSLNDPKNIQASFLECAELVNATVICTKFHHFEPYGVSGVVVISESHMTIHTWPEFKYAAVDVFTCSSKMESSKCLEFLASKLQSKNYTSKYIPRGFVKHLDMDEKQMQEYREYFLNFRERGAWGEKKQIEYVENQWVYQEGKYSRLGIPFDQVLYDKKSQFQDIKILNSPTMGRTLIIDHVFMICEKTQQNYHEMMVHPVMQVLLQKGKKDIKALIIGGGDGGAARELLRYPELNKVIVAELDGDVISSCREHIPKTAHAFDHQKVKIQLGDGLAYVEGTSDKYDLILCDGCDPVGQASNLFAESFYENCHKILNEDGIFLTQGQSPIAYKQQFLKTHNHLKNKFGDKNSGMIFYHQPLYEFGYWAFQIAIKNEQPTSIKKFSQVHLSQERIQEFVEKNDLKYYNYDIHLGSMAMPNYVKKMLKEGSSS